MCNHDWSRPFSGREQTVAERRYTAVAQDHSMVPGRAYQRCLVCGVTRFSPIQFGGMPSADVRPRETAWERICRVVWEAVWA